MCLMGVPLKPVCLLVLALHCAGPGGGGGLCSGDHSHLYRPVDDTEGGLSPLEGITLQLAFSPEGHWAGKPGDPIALEGIQTAEKR